MFAWALAAREPPRPPAGGVAGTDASRFLRDVEARDVDARDLVGVGSGPTRARLADDRLLFFAVLAEVAAGGLRLLFWRGGFGMAR